MTLFRNKTGKEGDCMTNRRQNSRNAANSTGQIPRRVENAAQSMSNQYSSGPRRGYIPPDTGRVPPVQGQWQGKGGYNPSGYYMNQNPQQQFPYSGSSPMTGSQRGYIMPTTRTAQPQKPPKKHGSVVTVIAVILLLAALGTGGYFSVTSYLHTKTIREKVEPYDNLFCPGVYVDGIHLGGMTLEQATNSIKSQIQQRHDAWKVQLMYNGMQVTEIDAGMLEFNVDPTEVIQKAWMQGHTGDQEQRYEDMLRMEQSPYTDNTAKPDGNTQVIDNKLAQIKTAIDRPAVDAEMTGFDPSLDYPFVFTDASYGFSLDTEPIKEKLYQMVSTMESGVVELAPERIDPSVTKEELIKSYMLRSSRTTPIDKHSPENRNKNIQHAFDFINGYVLEPGKTFSFNKVVGERTEARGFLEAIEYAYGEHVLGCGGGVCQASTTLYQAAVCAGLQIINREPHSDSVSYASYGMDATVYWSGKRKIDFSFKNTTDGNIYIVAGVQEDPGNRKRLIAKVTIYGQDMGNVWYDIETELVDTLPAPFKPKYVKDTDGTYVTYKDQQESVSKAKEGYVYKSYRVKYEGVIQTDRTLLFTDTYEPKAELIYVGVKDR